MCVCVHSSGEKLNFKKSTVTVFVCLVRKGVNRGACVCLRHRVIVGVGG